MIFCQKVEFLHQTLKQSSLRHDLVNASKFHERKPKNKPRPTQCRAVHRNGAEILERFNVDGKRVSSYICTFSDSWFADVHTPRIGVTSSNKIIFCGILSI